MINTFKYIEVPTDYKRILIEGGTGVGKTSLLRRLIGTTKAENFPPTSSGETTIFPIEFVLSPIIEYRLEAIVLPESKVRSLIRECLERALQVALENRDDRAVVEAFLYHPEQNVKQIGFRPGEH